MSYRLAWVIATGALAVALPAHAEEASDTVGLGMQYNISVNLDFEIDIPELLIFRVGSDGSVKDQIVFDVAQSPAPPTSDQSYNGQPLYGDGTVVAASNNGSLEVEVIANSGTAVITTSFDNTNGLSNGDGNFIPFDEIACESDNTGIPAPQLANVGTPPVTVTPNRHGGLVTEQVANWTYTYKNSQAVAAGTYVGIVTYTASVP